MKISIQWLKEKQACKDALEYLNARSDLNMDNIDAIKLIQDEIKTKEHLDWANWLIVRIMEYKQYAAYAIFAAEQVINIYEKKYPENKRPREAIEAAKKCVKDPSDDNKKAAAAAYAAAYAAAADAAYAAAAVAAAYAAAAAAYADAAYAAAAVAAAAKQEMQIKILKYGLKLLKGDL